MTSKSLQYWASKPATIDGVLGGYGALTEIDLRDSMAFFKQLRKSDKVARAADLGAGVGRVTVGLLSHIAETVRALTNRLSFSLRSGRSVRTSRKDETSSGRESDCRIVDRAHVYHSLKIC